MSAIRDVQTRGLLACIALVLAYGALVLTHRGEFWPFSVFPMYSRGMDSWSRPILLTLPEGEVNWDDVTLETLPGEVLSMFEPGIQRIELREAFDETEEWDPEGIQGLRALIGEENIRGRHVLLVEARGTLVPEEGVHTVVVPMAVFTSDATMFNPRHYGPDP